MGQSQTSRYYQRLKATNPEKYRNTRLAQQKRYNEGSDGNGGKGREITKAANKLDRKLGGTVGDGKDAAHDPKKKKGGSLQDPTTNRLRGRQRLKRKK